MSNEETAESRPWSARRPQNVVLSIALVIVAVFLVRQGITYINTGQGGLVPYFIILGGPALACYYTWYFCFRSFDDDAR